MGELIDKERNGFESFYNSLLQGKAYYEPNMSLPYQANVSDLRQKAFMKNTCRAVYKRAEETFGAGYGEKLVELLVRGDIKITEVEKYPFKEFPSLETYIYTLYYLNRGSFIENINNNKLNHIQFFAEIENLVISRLKLGESVNIIDLSMSLAIYFQRAKNLTKFGMADIKNTRDREAIFAQLLYRLVHVFSVHSDECCQPVTFSILDKVAYNSLMTNYRFSTIKDKNQFSGMLADHASMDYAYYLQTVKMLLNSLGNIARIWGKYRTPNVRVYLACTDARKKAFFEEVSRLTGCMYSHVALCFRQIKIYEGTNVNSSKFQEALASCVSLVTGRRRNNMPSIEHITKLLENFIKLGIPNENKLIIIDKEVQEIIMSQKHLPSHIELVYYVPNRGKIFAPCTSETTINYEYLAKNTQGLEDFKARLAEAYIDAQTINQLRRKFVNKNNSQYFKDKLNVKLANVDEDMLYTVYNVVNEQNTILKETYGDNFTFEVIKSIDVNEKFSKFYII